MFLLHLVKFVECLQETAREPLFVEAERCERVFGAGEGFDKGHCGMRFGVTRVPAIAMFFVTEGEEIVLGGGEAMEAELEIGAGAGEFSFGFTNRRERGHITGL